MTFFRPVPSQAGHTDRINATPSDLPFKSTGIATYPVPPQLGQSSGATLSPLRIEGIVTDASAKSVADCFALRITNKNSTLSAEKGAEESNPNESVISTETDPHSRDEPYLSA